MKGKIILTILILASSALVYSQNIGMTITQFQRDYRGAEEITSESNQRKGVRRFGYRDHSSNNAFENYFEYYFYFYEDKLFSYEREFMGNIQDFINLINKYPDYRDHVFEENDLYWSRLRFTIYPDVDEKHYLKIVIAFPTRNTRRNIPSNQGIIMIELYDRALYQKTY